MARPRPKKAAPPVEPPPLIPRAMNRFDRDVARLVKRGEDMGKYAAVIRVLCSRETLPAALKDHALKGEWEGWRDCHIAPDWVLIYRKTADELILARTGTHSDLFG